MHLTVTQETVFICYIDIDSFHKTITSLIIETSSLVVEIKT